MNTDTEYHQTLETDFFDKQAFFTWMQEIYINNTSNNKKNCQLVHNT